MTSTPRRVLAAILVVLAFAAGLAACGDGRPDFCDEFAKVADLKALRTALDGSDLPRARREASALEELAASAPDDIRADLEKLADAVSDIVKLVSDDRGTATTTTAPTSTAPTTPTRPPATTTTVAPAELERRREELNSRLADLSQQSATVGAWASRTCGLELG